MHHVSAYMRDGFAYRTAYTLTPDTISWRSYPPASPHRLTTTGSDPTLPHNQSEDQSQVRVVSITGLTMDASTRVREYQPVVHRLRLSASP
jgi:hypothetical protein